MTVRYTVRVRERVYARNVRLAAISAILLLLVGFLFIKQPAARPFELRSPNVVLLDIPVSQSPVLPKPPRPRVKPRLPVVSPDGRDDVDPGRTDGWDSLPKVDTAKALSTYKIGEVVEHMSEAVFLLEPAYPELARMAGIGGRVLVKLLVDVDGAVIDVGLLSGSGNSTLDRAALQAAARARFTPGRRGSRPCGSGSRYPIRLSSARALQRLTGDMTSNRAKPPCPPQARTRQGIRTGAAR